MKRELDLFSLNKSQPSSYCTITRWSNLLLIERETLQRFTSKLRCVTLYINETKCPAENDLIGVPLFRSALLVISKSTTWIYIRRLLFAKKFGVTVHKRDATAALRGELPHNLARFYVSAGRYEGCASALSCCPESQTPRDARDILSKFSEQRRRSVWILWRAKMHFPRRVI